MVIYMAALQAIYEAIGLACVEVDPEENDYVRAIESALIGSLAHDVITLYIFSYPCASLLPAVKSVRIKLT